MPATTMPRHGIIPPKRALPNAVLASWRFGFVPGEIALENSVVHYPPYSPLILNGAAL